MRHEKPRTKVLNTSNRALINANPDDPLVIEGYACSRARSALTWLAICLTLGLLRLYFFWRPSLALKCTHRRCSLNEATEILVVDKYKQEYIEKCKTIENVNFSGLFDKTWSNGLDEIVEEKEPLINDEKKATQTGFRYFVNKREKFYWNVSTKTFEHLQGVESSDIYLSQISRTNPNGLSLCEAQRRSLIYGPNSIRVELTPLLKLLIREVLSPFYCFQLFSVTVWCFENYFYYSACIFTISVMSIVYSLYSIRRNEQTLRHMISNSTPIRVHRHLRDGNDNGQVVVETIDSEGLVPGDLIEIEKDQIMQCDAILINGNVIVNESMLTGESIPITKVGIGIASNENSGGEGDEKLCLKRQKKNILFAGTSVIQTRYYANEPVKAVVLRTGFRTSKGELVRAILYPKPVEFRFNSDLYKYISALAVIAFFGMVYTIVLKVIRKKSFGDILIRTLDLISIVIPPALPGALTACLIYAQTRLKSVDIYCISPSTINVVGSITTFVFDKTGTLTEDDCSLRSILPTIVDYHATMSSDDAKMSSTSDEAKFVEFECTSVDSVPPHVLACLASCHSITRINNRLDGDPLDLKLFEFTRWDLVEPRQDDDEATNFDCMMPTIVRSLPQHELGIVRQFPFSSDLQRMGVVVKSLQKTCFEFYCKGSPEIIRNLCMTTTVPKNLQNVLNSFTKKGYRVIALAFKELDSSFNIVKIEKSLRETFESELVFLGDNLLTGISVARDCDMLVRPEQKLDSVGKKARGRRPKWSSPVKAKLVVIEANSYDPNQTPKFTLMNSECDLQLSNANANRLLRLNSSVVEVEKNSSSVSCDEDNNDWQHLIDDKRFQLHYAISGSSFEVVRNYYPEIFENLMRYGSIFARMSPDQKLQLIEGLQSLNYFVGMCGDGANDCEALKSANAGISLSQAEASIASPFTSKIPNISCVPLVILEGRSTLVASFGIVKFICMYSLTQFISVILLYTLDGNLADMQFLYIDLVLITFMAFFFSYNRPCGILHYKSPSAKLLSWRPILSLLFHLALIAATQLWPFQLVRSQPWFEAEHKYESSAIFLVSTYQYVTEAVVFSASLPYRRSILANRVFVVYLALAVAFNLLLFTQRVRAFNWFLELRPFPDWKFNVHLILIAAFHFFLAFIFETFVFDKDFSALYSMKYAKKM